MSHCARYRPISCDDIDTDGNATAALNRSILHMIYNMAMLSLHRSRFTSLLNDPKASFFEKELSELLMNHAAERISDIVGNINGFGLGGLLPPITISLAVVAAAHFLGTRGRPQATCVNGQEKYDQCMRIIEPMHEVYAAADLARVTMDMSLEDLPDHGYSSSVDMTCLIGGSVSWDDYGLSDEMLTSDFKDEQAPSPERSEDSGQTPLSVEFSLLGDRLEYSMEGVEVFEGLIV